MSKVDVMQSLPIWVEDIANPYGIALNLFCSCVVRDRFNVLNKYSKFNFIDTVDDIPEPKDTPLTDLMDQRAQELISKGSISAQWSGGVDSTALLLALIKNGVNKDDLIILYTKDSKEEYPKLYEWLEEQKYNLKKVINWRQSLGNAQTDIITNGWCADQLFGSIFFHHKPEYYSYPLKDFLSNITFPEKTKLTEEQINLAVEVYKQMGKDLFGLDINIAAELGWLINFCMKWTWVSTWNELFLCNTSNRLKTQVFYNTPEFQSWSVNNFSNIKTNNIYDSKVHKYYKKELKEYCNSVFPDTDFLNNKRKNPSWRTALNDRTLQIIVKADTGYFIYGIPDANLEKLTFYKEYYKKLE